MLRTARVPSKSKMIALILLSSSIVSNVKYQNLNVKFPLYSPLKLRGDEGGLRERVYHRNERLIIDQRFDMKCIRRR
jgi:hypothetical protein